MVQLEAAHLLLVLLSSQLYTPLASVPPAAQPLSTAIMHQADLAPSTVQLLLRHYTECQPLPQGAQVYAPDDGTPGVIRFVTSAAGASARLCACQCSDAWSAGAMRQGGVGAAPGAWATSGRHAGGVALPCCSRCRPQHP